MNTGANNTYTVDQFGYNPNMEISGGTQTENPQNESCAKQKDKTKK